MTLFTNNESKQGNTSQQRLWNEGIFGYHRVANELDITSSTFGIGKPRLAKCINLQSLQQSIAEIT
jgi:hypothetical protein